jgi:hypothetical protein
MMPAHALALASSAACRCFKAGIRSLHHFFGEQAMCMAVGNVSFDDWLMLT